MRLDRNEIKKNKFGFTFICFGLIISIMIMLNINNLFTESEEIEAIVTKVYKDHRGHGKPRPKMNIEWVDLNGDIQTEGSMYNKYRLSVGDTYIILVDKETHSEMTTSPTGSIVMFIIGLLGLIFNLFAMNILYGYDKSRIH